VVPSGKVQLLDFGPLLLVLQKTLQASSISPSICRPSPVNSLLNFCAFSQTFVANCSIVVAFTMKHCLATQVSNFLSLPKQRRRESKQLRVRVFKPVLPSPNRFEGPYKQPESHSLGSPHSLQLDYFKNNLKMERLKRKKTHFDFLQKLTHFTGLQKLSFFIIWFCRMINLLRGIKHFSNCRSYDTNATATPLIRTR